MKRKTEKKESTGWGHFCPCCEKEDTVPSYDDVDAPCIDCAADKADALYDAMKEREWGL